MLPRYSARVSRDGFGLLETIAAIGVITTGLFAVLTLVFSNMRSADEAGLRYGAVAAAREGIEVVRMIRDANWIAGDAWDEGITGSAATTTAVLTFDPTSVGWAPVFGAYTFDHPGARIVRRTAAAGTFWTQGDETAGAEVTPYRRLVRVLPICSVEAATPGAPDRATLEGDGAQCPPETKVGALVRSTVQWASRGSARSVTVEEALYDWR